MFWFLQLDVFCHLEFCHNRKKHCWKVTVFILGEETLTPALLNWFKNHFGTTMCSVQLISVRTSQEEIQCNQSLSADMVLLPNLCSMVLGLIHPKFSKPQNMLENQLIFVIQYWNFLDTENLPSKYLASLPHCALCIT